MSNKKFIERTLVILKPDAVQRSLVGETVKRFENLGLKFVGIKLVLPKKENVRMHYTVDPDWIRLTGEKAMKAKENQGINISESAEEIGERVLESLIKFMTSGPVVVIAVEGASAV